ncbi:hypothetical protein BGZ96_001135 [Linnemannia gamsii]|uniref:Uncharacterized protein n=1 Tax=Linnemannia gamsii TaxID=64522 RepID=A0ABQ7JMR6_9FUNG|nr:hypothetical protein BGZ96_001135 [Linnemannia gamsii]
MTTAQTRNRLKRVHEHGQEVVPAFDLYLGVGSAPSTITNDTPVGHPAIASAIPDTHLMQSVYVYMSGSGMERRDLGTFVADSGARSGQAQMVLHDPLNMANAAESKSNTDNSGVPGGNLPVSIQMCIALQRQLQDQHSALASAFCQQTAIIWRQFATLQESHQENTEGLNAAGVSKLIIVKHATKQSSIITEAAAVRAKRMVPMTQAQEAQWSGNNWSRCRVSSSLAQSPGSTEIWNWFLAGDLYRINKPRKRQSYWRFWWQEQVIEKRLLQAYQEFDQQQTAPQNIDGPFAAYGLVAATGLLNLDAATKDVDMAATLYQQQRQDKTQSSQCQYLQEAQQRVFQQAQLQPASTTHTAALASGIGASSRHDPYCIRCRPLAMFRPLNA